MDCQMGCLTGFLTDCLMGCLMVGSIVLHNQVHHKIDKQIDIRQGVSTIFKDIKETVAITVDLQKVYLMGCLMVGSKVFAWEILT